MSKICTEGTDTGVGSVLESLTVTLASLHEIVCRAATIMKKSWNFWNFEIFWNFWKIHGIEIWNRHGKLTHNLKRSWNFLIHSWKNHVKVMEFCHGDFVATLVSRI